MTIYCITLFSDCLNLCCTEDAEADPGDLKNSETTTFNNKQEIFCLLIMLVLDQSKRGLYLF